MVKTTKENKFYVYAIYQSPEDKTPRYFGMGSGRRIKETLRASKAMGHKRHGLLKYPKAEARYLFKGLSQDEAFAIEIQLIKDGRAFGLDLWNATEGGDTGPRLLGERNHKWLGHDYAGVISYCLKNKIPLIEGFNGNYPLSRQAYAYAKRHGIDTSQLPSGHGRKRLITMEIAKAIRADFADGTCLKDVAKKYKVSKGATWNILNNKSYKEAT
jgi:hypothetical protein